MSNTKQYLEEAIDIENWPAYMDPGFGETPGYSEPFYYPGEQEAELEAAFKAHELSKYTDEELHAEIARRTFEPARILLEEAKANLDKSLGITPERPF